MNRSYDLVVLGAGISGLAMAHYAARDGWRVALADPAPAPGGCLATLRCSGEAGGFWVELGAHTCFNSYGGLIGLLETCGLASRLLPKQKLRYRMLAGGRQSSIVSRLHFAELLVALPRLLTAQKTGKSVAEYYGRVMGRANYRNVLGPAFNAVICQPADGFPAESLFRSRVRRRDVMRSFTVPGGLQAIAEALASGPGIDHMPGQAVEGVSTGGGEYRVTLAGGRRLAAPRLALATPPAAAAKLSAALLPGLSQTLSRIAAVDVASVAVVVRSDAVRLPPLAGLIAVDEDFYSMVSRDPVPDPGYRGFTFHFNPQRLDPERRIDRICQILGVRREQLVAAQARINRLPALRVGHPALVEDLDRLLGSHRLALTGNYFTGVSIEDCVSRSAAEYARLRRLG